MFTSRHSEFYLPLLGDFSLDSLWMQAISKKDKAKYQKPRLGQKIAGIMAMSTLAGKLARRCQKKNLAVIDITSLHGGIHDSPLRQPTMKIPKTNTGVYLYPIASAISKEGKRSGYICLASCFRHVDDTDHKLDLVYYSSDKRSRQIHSRLTEKHSQRSGPGDFYPGSSGFLKFHLDENDSIATLKELQYSLNPKKTNEDANSRKLFESIPEEDRIWSSPLVRTFIALCSTSNIEHIIHTPHKETDRDHAVRVAERMERVGKRFGYQVFQGVHETDYRHRPFILEKCK